MRWMLILTCGLLTAALAAQEPAKPEPAKPADPATEPAKPVPAERERPRMGEDAQKLFDDVNLVYSRYYELVLAKVKADERYSAAEVWEEAVKAARNARYAKADDFHEAITAMKAKDRLFRREVNDLTTKLARDHAEAVREAQRRD
jgi:hypothetical protein